MINLHFRKLLEGFLEIGVLYHPISPDFFDNGLYMNVGESHDSHDVLPIKKPKKETHRQHLHPVSAG